MKRGPWRALPYSIKTTHPRKRTACHYRFRTVPTCQLVRQTRVRISRVRWASRLPIRAFSASEGDLLAIDLFRPSRSIPQDAEHGRRDAHPTRVFARAIGDGENHVAANGTFQL